MTRSLTAVTASTVRAELARAGIKQRLAADRLGMSEQAFYRRASGQLGFTVDQLAELAGLLGTTLVVDSPDGYQVTASFVEPQQVAS